MKNGPWSHSVIEKIVKVSDDHLTLRGGKYCQLLSWMIIEKVGKRENDASGGCVAVSGEGRGEFLPHKLNLVVKNTASMDECAAAVKTAYPALDDPGAPNGAERNKRQGNCYAWFDLQTYVGGDGNSEVCKFGETMTPPALRQFDPVWLPSSTTDAGVWWEMDTVGRDPSSARRATEEEEIGLVSFHPPGTKTPNGKNDGYGDWSCRSRWLYDGNWCQERSHTNTGPGYRSDAPYPSGLYAWNEYASISASSVEITTKNPPNTTGTWTWNADKDFHGGIYEGAHQGAIVTLSNQPCDFTNPENPICPPATATCGRIDRPRMCPHADNAYCPPVVDCKGAKGRYVRVQLPGTGRILDAHIRVHRRRPSPSFPSDMVCYGVEMRSPTSIDKEFTTTPDMEDPMFYSTCFLREKYRSKWVKFPRSFPPGDWSFGEQCLDCGSYNDATTNLNSGDTQGRRLNKWLAAPRCADCTKGVHGLNFSTTVGTGGGGGGTDTDAGTSTGTGGTGTSAENSTGSGTGSSKASFTSTDGKMKVDMHYHAGQDDSTNYVDFVVTYESSAGWFAVGVSKEGKMVSSGQNGGTDVFACERGSDGETRVKRYWMTERDIGWVSEGVLMEKPPPTTIEHSLTENTKNLASCTFDRGRGTLNFRRILGLEEGSVDAQREIVLESDTHFVWAHGSSEAGLVYHGGQSRGTATVVLGVTRVEVANETAGSGGTGNATAGGMTGGTSGSNSDPTDPPSPSSSPMSGPAPGQGNSGSTDSPSPSSSPMPGPAPGQGNSGSTDSPSPSSSPMPGGDGNDDEGTVNNGGTEHDILWTQDFSGNAADRELTVAAGDTITFMWSGDHNVYKLADAAAYASCDFAGATDVGSISPVTVAVGTTEEWYACQIGGHCVVGQKLHVTISADAGSSPTHGPAPGQGNSGPTDPPSPSSSPMPGGNGNDNEGTINNGGTNKDTDGTTKYTGGAKGSAGGTDKDDNGSSKATILRSTLTITGIEVSDLNDGETLDKIVQSIASSLRVPLGAVAIDEVTTARRRRLSDPAVVIRYSVTVTNPSDIGGVRERMEGLSSNVELLQVVASQVGVAQGTLTVTGGSVVAEESLDAADVRSEADAGGFVMETWMYVVVVVVILFGAGGAFAISRLSSRDKDGKKETIKAVAMTVMTTTTPAAGAAGVGTILGRPVSPLATVPPRPTSGKHANARKSAGRSNSGVSQGKGSEYLSNLYHTVGSPNEDQLQGSDMKRVGRGVSSKNEGDGNDGDGGEDTYYVRPFDQSIAAPPTDDQRRTLARRNLRKEKRSLQTASTPSSTLASSLFRDGGQEETSRVSTAFGVGSLLRMRKADGCQVIELPWKLAGGSKAILFRFVGSTK